MRFQWRNGAENLARASAADPRSFNAMELSLASDARPHMPNALSRKWRCCVMTTVNAPVSASNCAEGMRMMRRTATLKSP
jgi:hypothetical protein